MSQSPTDAATTANPAAGTVVTVTLPEQRHDVATLLRRAAVHAPLELPRKPWDQLSDHAPLAAEILL